MNQALEIDGVNLFYKGRKILTDIYLKLEVGSISGLAGRNGQGKSSLLSMLAGSPKGEKSIRIDKSAIKTGFKVDSRIAYLPQHHFIPKHFTINKALQLLGLSSDGLLVRFPQFSKLMETKIGHLSGGERRIVEIYSVLSSDSDFLLLDEPFNKVMPLHVETIHSWLQELKSHKGILVTGLSEEKLDAFCDTVYRLETGVLKMA